MKSPPSLTPMLLSRNYAHKEQTSNTSEICLESMSLKLITGAGDAFVFLKDRFNGVSAATGCSTTTVLQDGFNPAAIEAMGSDCGRRLGSYFGASNW